MISEQEQEWRKTLLSSEAQISDAVRNLEESGLQIVLVVSNDEILQGTVTDGDIRRGLLRGLDLRSKISSIIHEEALVVPTEIKRSLVVQLMKSNQIRQIPIVDEERRVVGLHLWDETNLSVVRHNTMVIMAGGRGTRLGERTQNCPKPLLPIAGKPILEHIIERSKTEGFTRFVISVHYLGHMIEEYFHQGEKWQVQIDYVREQEPLGTAGAISLLNPRPEIPFIVSNGDILTDIHYGELLDFHIQNRAVATMASRLYEHQNPFGVVSTRGVEIVGFEEKPIVRSYINAGIYVIDPMALECLSTNLYCNMTTLFERLRILGKKTVIYPIHEPWLDVGRPEDLKRAEE